MRDAHNRVTRRRITGPNLDGIITSSPGLSRPCAIIVIWTVSGFGFDGD
jgi:hypothetical protein